MHKNEHYSYDSAIPNKTQDIFSLSCPYSNEYQGSARRVLFVCSAGMLRSATAAKVGNSMGFNTRACGSENYALIPLSVNLISWADVIYFVNSYNFVSAKHTFFEDYDTKSMLDDKSTVWDIEDIYNYDDPQLVRIITKLLS